MNELGIIQSELVAPKGQFNGFGKYKYRSCEDILEAVKPLLTANLCVLTISDKINAIGDRFYVEATATITNEKGFAVSVTASARESLDKKGMDSAQITGATSSYARKYALNGLFAIDDTKDADTKDNSPEPEPEKAWLNIDSAEWKKALTWIENTPNLPDYVGAIEKKYKLSKETKAKLVEFLRELG